MTTYCNCYLLIDDTFDATVNELLTLAPAKLSIAAKLVVKLAPASERVTTCADMFFPMLGV